MSSLFRRTARRALHALWLATWMSSVALAGPQDEAPQAPRGAALKRVFVLDMDLTGDTGGADFEIEHQQRMRLASARLVDELRRSGLYEVVDTAPAAELIERLGAHQYLHRCNGCEFDIARKLNADLVLVPWVFRMSHLILSLHVEIRDVATGRTIMGTAKSFRGDNDYAWSRAITYLVRDLKEQGW